MKISKFNYVRVASGSPELQIANVDFNYKSITKEIEKAENNKVDIIVFPELVLSAYSCGDLFFQSVLLNSCIDYLIKIKEESKNYNLILILGLPMVVNNRLFNVAAVIYKGEILGIVPKTFLCNYNEYYEKRWFSSSNDSVSEIVLIDNQEIAFGSDIIFSCNNLPDLKFGIEICEDLWAVKPPSSDLSLAGANIIFNLSSSNEYLSKSEYRRDLIKSQSAKCICAYAYSSSNSSESTTDTVFSGHLLIAENGRLLAESERFYFNSRSIYQDIDLDIIVSEKLKNKTFSESKFGKPFRIVSFNFEPEQKSELIRNFAKNPFVPSNLDDKNKVCSEITSIQATGLAKRLKHIGCKNITIGISGGLDSTIALLSTVKAFNMLDLDLKGIHAVTMPGFGTTNRTYKNAINLIKKLKVTLYEININDSVTQHFKDIDHDINNHNIVFENSQARMRTMVLMDLANKVNGIVVGTGDLSEIALGWATYNGDHMSMYGINAGIPKTLIKYIIEWYAKEVFTDDVSMILKDIYDTPISPELLPVNEFGENIQETEKSIGKYELNDFFLYYFIRFGFSPEKLFFIAMKVFLDDYNEEEIKITLNSFFERFFNNQFKRSAIPDSVKVGSVALSPRADWRMPSDSGKNLWKIIDV